MGKDIMEFSQPATRLIEVISQGIGRISEPRLIKELAKAEAEKIQTIGSAVSKANTENPGLDIFYHDDKIAIKSAQDKAVVELPDTPLGNRTSSRMAYQETKKQLNLEAVTQFAFENLDEAEEIGTERPDSDWITRFFRIAEDISTEQMQALWGRVLAGEVKQPKSYSLRTLDVLRNMSQEEAETFVRVGSLAFSGIGTPLCQDSCPVD
uniref:TIGR03899 family protein n=1 Tax=Candidatus Kentrum sp. TUN TaxID=2126343 RepID=A0A451APZ4_9GAMM|nr:MAG: TIGR03899 family protein [Candidatus Kentron sp. TUN]VFK68062.1 MAG: TIGR03899 family protein [Candidatus Kentron sp. TUN]